MRYLVFISNTAILFFIFFSIIIGIFERKNVFDLFIKGCKDGVKVIWNIFPSLLALIVAVGMLNSCGIIDFLGELFYPILKFFKLEKDFISLIILRPVSASTTTALATDIMKKYGTDSRAGLIASTIMGATETTIYVVTLYCSKVKIKNVKEVLFIGLLADLIGMLIAIVIYS